MRHDRSHDHSSWYACTGLFHELSPTLPWSWPALASVQRSAIRRRERVRDMRLRAIITIDIDAADFVDAADHQRRIESLLGAMRDSYADAALEFRERRQVRRGMSPGHPPGGRLSSTGKLNSYVD